MQKENTKKLFYKQHLATLLPDCWLIDYKTSFNEEKDFVFNFCLNSIKQLMKISEMFPLVKFFPAKIY